jgi:hypothetical protein
MRNAERAAAAKAEQAAVIEIELDATAPEPLETPEPLKMPEPTAATTADRRLTFPAMRLAA